MRHAVIIIGSSYGDEGKGLAAAWSARRMGGRCLNILINGGAQRGHTVDLPDGRRHVFHHFGAATLEGAVSCAAFTLAFSICGMQLSYQMVPS